MTTSVDAQRSKKRARCDATAPQPTGDSARGDDDAVQQETRALVASLLTALALPPSLVQSDRALLRLKALPIRLGLGVGVFATDIAVRLYHAHAAASSAKRPKTQTSEHTSSSERETLEAFAVRAVELLCHALESDADGRFRRIQRVSLPDAGATSLHGLHAHRILLHTREYAASVASVDDALAALEAKRLPIVFRDDALLVVDKPADMLSVDGNDGAADLGDSVQRVVQQLFPDARMVHRLDFQTSGLLVVALTRTAAQHLSEQFRSRKIEKVYVARVRGALQPDSGTVRVHMARAPNERLQRCVVEAPDGVETTTHWSVLQRNDDDENDSTLVRLRPVTGHTHQLRVHMHHLGHAILGDALYDAARVESLAPRLLLHAQSITFTHPVTEQRVTLTSATPTPF